MKPKPKSQEPALEHLLQLLRRHHVQEYSAGGMTVRFSPQAFESPRQGTPAEPPSAAAEAFPDEDPDLFHSSGRV